MDRLVDRGVVRIAATWDRSWEQYLDPSTGVPAGMVAKVGRLLGDDLGVSAEFLDMAWADQLPALINGQVDVCLKHTNLPQRAGQVRFTRTPFLKYRGVIFVRNDDGRIGLSAFQIRRSRVAVTDGSLHGQIARQVLTGWEIVETRSATESIERLAASGVDAVITDDNVGTPPGIQALSEPDGDVVVVSRDASYPSVRHDDEMWFRWLDNWMSYHKLQGTLDRLIDLSKAEHAETGLSLGG